MSGDRRLDFFPIDTETLSLDDELLNLTPEEFGTLFAGGIGKLGDDGADTGTGFKQALIDEVRNDFMGSIGVDLEIFA